MRSFGPIRVRRRAGELGWKGDHRVCLADRVLTLASGLTIPDGSGHWNCNLRRFIHDGSTVAKFGIAFISWPRWQERTWTREAVEASIDQLLSQNAVIRPHSSRHKRIRLGDCGPELARAFIESSTRLGAAAPEKWWATAGTPLLLLETDFFDDHIEEAPSGANLVFDEQQVRVWHLWRTFAGRDLPAWLIERRALNAASRELVRALRLRLSRLHAERECLALVLMQIAAGRLVPTPRTEPADALQSYLNVTIRNIQRMLMQGKRSNPTNTPPSPEELAAKCASSLDQRVIPGEYESLVDEAVARLAKLGVRPNISRKVANAMALGRRSEPQDAPMPEVATGDGSPTLDEGEILAGTALSPALRTRLVETLLRIPAAQNFEMRSALLLGIPGTTSLNRLASNARTDIVHIVEQLAALGRMSSGVPALRMLIDNAILYVEGSDVADALREIAGVIPNNKVTI